MNDYVLKILTRFKMIDDAQAREQASRIVVLSDADGMVGAPFEFTLRRDGTDRVVAKGTITPHGLMDEIKRLKARVVELEGEKS